MHKLDDKNVSKLKLVRFLDTEVGIIEQSYFQNLEDCMNDVLYLFLIGFLKQVSNGDFDV